MLDQESKKRIKTPLSPSDRLLIISKESTSMFTKLEDAFRKQLLKKAIFTEHNLPEIKYPDQEQQAKKVKKETDGTPQDVPAVGVLDRAHVLERLGIQASDGLSGEVLARIACATIVPVKHEDGADSHKDIDSLAPGSQPSDGEWRKVRLISLELPEARVTDADGRVLAVKVDDLRPVPKVSEAPRVIHPSLLNRAQPCKMLETFDFDACLPAVAQSLAEHVLQWLQMCAHACVGQVDISMHNEDGKLPIILQARAKEYIKKGALTFVPAYGTLTKGKLDEENKARSQAVLHDAMLHKVELTVTVQRKFKKAATAAATSEEAESEEQPKRGKKAGPEVIVEHYVLSSPLLLSKKKPSLEGLGESTKNSNPFWAVLRCAASKSVHNMQMEHLCFQALGATTKAPFPKFPKGMDCHVEVPILRNVSTISQGEILTLPFTEE